MQFVIARSAVEKSDGVLDPTQNAADVDRKKLFSVSKNNIFLLIKIVTVPG